MRLFPSALHPNRDGFKMSRLFSWLMKWNCAAVEAGSSALGANRDNRRRRGSADFCEIELGSLPTAPKQGPRHLCHNVPRRSIKLPLKSTRVYLHCVTQGLPRIL